ncbi:MAG TPA: hypothetical protein VGG33_23360, partial [Polyangia bacterium]
MSLLGRTADDPEVQKALKDIAHGAQPELDPEDEDKLVDWILVNELGLEFGFEDEAYVRAEDPEKRRQSPLLFTQVYFYGETARTEACPLPLPFGLALADDRNVVRSKLRAHEAVRRSYVRDAWELPDFNLIVAYSKDTGLVESVLAHIRYSPWPDRADAAATVAAFTPEFFRGLFGVRWSQERLRHDFGPLGYEAELPSVRSAHTADFRLSHGIELHFSPCRDIAGADLT